MKIGVLTDLAAVIKQSVCLPVCLSVCPSCHLVCLASLKADIKTIISLPQSSKLNILNQQLTAQGKQGSSVLTAIR
jgi:hypothetical protein